MNKENCALKLVDEIILQISYFLQITFYGPPGNRVWQTLVAYQVLRIIVRQRIDIDIHNMAVDKTKDAKLLGAHFLPIYETILTVNCHTAHRPI